MANYDALKASVDKNGEVMIRLDTGEKIELHSSQNPAILLL